MFGMPQQTVGHILTNFRHLSEIGKDFTPPIYNIWNLAKQSIADMFGVDKATINRVLQIGQMSEMQQDFTPPITNFAHLGEIGKDFTPPIYNIWNWFLLDLSPGKRL